MKIKFSLLLFIFLSAQFFSCQKKEADKSLSLKVYDIPLGAVYSYCYFSPLNDSKIWLTGRDFSQEFDTATGKFTNLSERFGDFSAGIDDKVFTDEYDTSLIWICNFHKGLLIYDKLKGTSIKYPANQYFHREAMLVVKPEKDLVWIGTSDGIYYINRSDWKIEQAVKTKIWADSIQRLGSDEIMFGRIDGSYQGSNWCKLKISTKELMEIPCPPLPNRVTRILASIKPGVEIDSRDIYEIDDDTDVAWCIDKLGLEQIDKKTGIIKYVDLGCQGMGGTNHTILVGTSTLWVICSDKLISINKNGISQIVVERTIIEEKLKKIYDLEAEIWHEQSPVMFFKKMMTVISLYDDMYKFKNTSFESVFGPKRMLIEVLCHRDISEIEKYMQANAPDPIMTPLLLYGSVCAYSLNGNPKQALDSYESLMQKYPSHKVLKYIRPEDIQTLKDGLKDLNIIKGEKLPPDQKLWEVGQAYTRMMRVDWNMREGGFNMYYPDSIFNEILQKFPHSTYADNAWWEIHLGYEDWDGDFNTFFLETMLSKYKEFLARYPSSELVPLAKYLMSQDILYAVNYAEENSTDKEALPLDECRAYLDTAKQMCEEAIQGGLPEEDELHYSMPPERSLDEIEKHLQKYRSIQTK